MQTSGAAKLLVITQSRHMIRLEELLLLEHVITYLNARNRRIDS
jgi:hypothetical protein